MPLLMQQTVRIGRSTLSELPLSRLLLFDIDKICESPNWSLVCKWIKACCCDRL